MPTEGEPDPEKQNALPVLQPLAYQPVRQESGALTAWSIFLLRFFTFAVQLVGAFAGLLAIMSYFDRKPLGDVAYSAAACIVSWIAAWGLHKLADWIR